MESSSKGDESGRKSPTLAFLVDDDGRRVYRLERSSTKIGRDPSSAVLVDDPEVSRQHADVRVEPGGYVLHTSGKSGTYVNGDRVDRPFVLREGDKIEVGRTTFLFTWRPTPAGYAIGPDVELLSDIMSGASADSTTFVTRRSRPVSPLWRIVAIAAVILAVIAVAVLVLRSR